MNHTDHKTMTTVTVIAGRTTSGLACVQACLAKGYQVKATSRSPFEMDGVETCVANVRDIDSLREVIPGSDVVVFAASAAAGWRLPNTGLFPSTPKEIDYKGLVNVGQVCLECGVPRLLVISSACVTRGYSDVAYAFLNTLFGRIMHWKRQGEIELQALYDVGPEECTYTIIRPGGLTNKPAVHPRSMQFGRGDTISGKNGTPRETLGQIVCEAIHREYVFNDIFECAGNGEQITEAYNYDEDPTAWDQTFNQLH
eukprot:TRINITY_DN9665_c0_g1_i1.p1 TRINITY_DN9665_c0_g1~~TRINITY_DN9665_c0_g1_i1.p1  ORF type:complete len:255 (-),score=41.99 TRINITY_DN9665_c0_g1_i1:24-788(-)